MTPAFGRPEGSADLQDPVGLSALLDNLPKGAERYVSGPFTCGFGHDISRLRGSLDLDFTGVEIRRRNKKLEMPMTLRQFST